MIAGYAITRLAERFVILEVWKAAKFGAKPNSVWKDAGEKERIIADVRSDVEAGRIVRRLKRRQHVEEIFEGFWFPIDFALHLLGARVFGQHLSDIIRY